jgi:hypothetical protein
VLSECCSRSYHTFSVGQGFHPRFYSFILVSIRNKDKIRKKFSSATVPGLLPPCEAGHQLPQKPSLAMSNFALASSVMGSWHVLHAGVQQGHRGVVEKRRGKHVGLTRIQGLDFEGAPHLDSAHHTPFVPASKIILDPAALRVFDCRRDIMMLSRRDRMTRIWH